MITTCIFCLLTCWDEFLFSLIFTTSYNAKTVTVAISEFTTRHMIDYGLMMAAVCWRPCRRFCLRCSCRSMWSTA